VFIRMGVAPGLWIKAEIVSGGVWEYGCY
jgi:hypothetical protein